MTVRKLAADVEAVCAAVPDPAVADQQADPLLAAIEAARARMAAADHEIRLLLAYGRRFVYPHPYTLGELAAASGMSVSGVRTAFGSEDVRQVSEVTGLEPVSADGEGS
jgi:AraC-like DNA-binding protein